jgi:hypothetical protein
MVAVSNAASIAALRKCLNKEEEPERETRGTFVIEEEIVSSYQQL